MNVLQLTPELNAGGVEGTTLEMAEALIKAGHGAHVVSAGGRMADDLTAMGAVLHPMDIGSKNILTYWRRVKALCALIKSHDIDIIHARSRAPAWPGLAAARKMNIPFIATYHGIYNAKSALKRRYNAVMTRGELTIANSNMTKDHIIREHGLDPARIIVIPRGVDMAKFDSAHIKPSDIASTRQAWGLMPGDYAVLLPGRLTAWKGQPIAVLALAALPQNIKLIIMGDAQGRDDYVASLKSLAQTSGTAARVTFAAHSADMPLMLAASDIVLSTSVEPEAFGRIAVEAQAMGKPIIATAHGGSLETVLPQQTGLWVPPGDSRALSEAIINVHGGAKFDPEFARAHIRANFSKQQLQEKTLAVYSRLG